MSPIRINTLYQIIRKAIILLSIFFILTFVFSPDHVFADAEDDRFWNTTSVIGVLIVLPIVVSLALPYYQKRKQSPKTELKKDNEVNKTINSKNTLIKDHFSLTNNQVVFHW